MLILISLFFFFRPLESEVSIWGYDVVAVDSEGLKVTDRLDIHVQQHKQIRAVNHEFSIYLKIDKRSEFPTNVDWEIKVGSGNTEKDI